MKKLIFKIVFLASIIFALNTPLYAAAYKLDEDHTSVTFKIKHLFSYVSGNFGKFEGTIEYEPGKPETWKTEATIQAASINTNVEGRDKHLKSADFFDAAKYPTITFKSTGVSDVTESSAKLVGDLTIHGVTKPVTLDLEILGVAKDPWGNTVAGFQAAITINRKDYGLTWNKAVETGGVLVGEEVEITIDAAGLLKS